MIDNFDIKVGFTCNNNCIHCVVKPNVMKMNASGESLDLTTEEVLERLNLDRVRNAEHITLTGGEITIRPDFHEIMDGLKVVVEQCDPKPVINMQTNGRCLEEHLEYLKGTGLDMQYVVALHSSDEALHNKIVGNKKDSGNPYQETMRAISKIIELYGNFDEFARIELVLSKYNLHDFVKTAMDLYDMGIKMVGISYPHLCGFEEIFSTKYVQDTGTGYPHFLDEPFKIGETLVNKIGFSYADLRPELVKLYDFAKNHPDAAIGLEEFPLCVFRDENNMLLEMIPNLGMMGHAPDTSTQIATPNGVIVEDFRRLFIQDHLQLKVCKFCVLKSECLGIWSEAARAFGDKGLTPITPEELNKIVAASCNK